VNGWTVCRFQAREAVAERQAECNYRHGGRTKAMIEVWKLIKSLADVAFSLVNRSTARDSRLRCVSSPVAFHAFRHQAELSGFEKAAIGWPIDPVRNAARGWQSHAAAYNLYLTFYNEDCTWRQP
jgi:hypothetical protein